MSIDLTVGKVYLNSKGSIAYVIIEPIRPAPGMNERNAIAVWAARNSPVRVGTVLRTSGIGFVEAEYDADTMEWKPVKQPGVFEPGDRFVTLHGNGARSPIGTVVKVDDYDDARLGAIFDDEPTIVRTAGVSWSPQFYVKAD